MSTAATAPIQGQILVNIDDISMLKDIKKAISMLKGAGKITVPRSKRIMNILELSEQEIIRRNNLQQLRDLGIDLRHTWHPLPAHVAFFRLWDS